MHPFRISFSQGGCTGSLKKVFFMEDAMFEDPLLHETGDFPKRKISEDPVKKFSFKGRDFLELDAEGLSLLAERAFHDLAFFLRVSHLEQLAAILEDPEASSNDRLVAFELLKNACIAAAGIFPLCQDTGTAMVMAKKGEGILTGADDAVFLSRGIHKAYTENAFRYSQLAPLFLYTEKNTGNNLPAQIDIQAVSGGSYDFLFVAKGGGSANKTFLFNKTREILSEEKLTSFLAEVLPEIGVSACPPYHLSLVIGGMSPEYNLKALKLASTGYLDNLPQEGNSFGRAFRDLSLEAKLLDLGRKTGLGAQFGGKYFCLDARVIRLPRHGASCFVSIGASCVAHRNMRGKITEEGIFLEKLEENPARFLPDPDLDFSKSISIDLGKPMGEIRDALSGLPVGTALLLNGPMVVARDMAHARLKEMLERGENLPKYFSEHPVYYAGPAKTPKGFASGSFGPTTAGRMDSYIPLFQKKGASLVTLAKGNRSQIVRDSCRKFGGFYLGSIGGAAALLGRDCIEKMEVLDFEDLGMEAVYRIQVKDFPAFLIVDDKGNDFYARLC